MIVIMVVVIMKMTIMDPLELCYKTLAIIIITFAITQK